MRLGRDGAVDDLVQMRPPVVLLKQPDDFRVGDEAHLDRLGKAVGKVPLRQRAQHVAVDEHRPGLVERADDVLDAGKVDGHLAAHRRVDLRQRGGGDAHKVDAAHVAGRHEPRQVAHDAAAQPDHQVLSCKAVLQQRRAQLLIHRERLCALAHVHRANETLRALRQQLLRVSRGHAVVGHDHHPAA